MRRPRKDIVLPQRSCGACPRAVVATAVGGAVRVVIEDYLRFLLDEDGGSDAAKAFMARHAAARSALAHVETLLKLVTGHDAVTADNFQDGFMLLGQAREALGAPVEDEAGEGTLDGEPALG